jgi:hypothetical protein
MKLKSLLLGSAAALALSTGAQAADPAGLASFVALDVCDAYGISGITISSDDTCLQISGNVSYEFRWGDYGPSVTSYNYYGDGGGTGSIMNEDGTNDWRSRLEYNLRFEATTATDAGPARATVLLRERQRSGGGDDSGDRGFPLRAEQAFVSFGDTTVISAGMQPSIARTGRDTPYNWLGLYNAAEAGGVDWKFAGPNRVREGGTGIAIVSEIGDGFSAGIALENINRWSEVRVATGSGDPLVPVLANNARVNELVTDPRAGTLVGFVEASGAWGGAHATIMVDDALNGFDDAQFAWHTGATANLDQFAITAALAGNSDEYWNGLLSGRGEFDMFTIAASAEFASVGSGNAANNTGEDLLGLGFGASAGFNVTDTVAINLGGRYWDADSDSAVASNTEVWEIALGVSAEVSEGLSATGKVGFEGAGENAGNINVAAGTFVTGGIPDDGAVFGEVGLAYAPGGGFTTGGVARVNSYGAYRLTFNAAKSF